MFGYGLVLERAEAGEDGSQGAKKGGSMNFEDVDGIQAFQRSNLVVSCLYMMHHVPAVVS